MFYFLCFVCFSFFFRLRDFFFGRSHNIFFCFFTALFWFYTKTVLDLEAESCTVRLNALNAGPHVPISLCFPLFQRGIPVLEVSV